MSGKVVEVEDEKQFDELLRKWDRVAVDFNAEWCGPCKKMTPIYKELAAETKNVLFVSIDVDKNDDLASRFSEDTAAIPCFIFFHKGKQQTTLKVQGASEKKLKTSIAALSKL